MAEPEKAQPAPIESRLREGIQMVREYLEQPETERAAGASALLASAQRAHEQLVQVTERAIQALPREGDADDDRAAALAATGDITERAGLPAPDDIAARTGSGDAWVADASARYTGFVIAALTAQDALLDGSIPPGDYARVLLAAARDIAATAEPG